MAERPKNTRLVKGFNYGVDKRIPLGISDQVVDKKTGLLVGFIKNGKFYNLGDKVEDEPKAPKADKPSDLKNSIRMGETLLEIKEKAILEYEPGTETYNKIATAINKDKAAIKDLEERLSVADVSEANKEKADTYKAEKSTWDSQVAEAKKKVQIAKDTGGNVNAAQVKLDKILRSEPKAPVAKTAPKEKPSAVTGPPLTTPTPGVSPASTVTETPETEGVITPPKTGTTLKSGTTPKAGTKPKETTPPKEGKVPPPAKKVLTIDEIIDAVANEYGSIDTIFKTDPGLQALLRKAIGKDGVPNTDDDLTPAQFVNELENTDWFKTNANAVRQRGFYKRQFDDLVAGGADTEELYKTTEYGRGLRNTQQVIADEIVRVGGSLSPEEIELISRDIYDLGYENQKAIVSQRIRAKINYKPGGIVGGEAGVNLAALRKTAAANGLDLEKNFGDSLDGWLQKLAQGESIETFKQIIRGSAKIGLPEKVSGLLDNGVDLDTVYNPYKRLMASVLEINPESITLDDSVLRSAIGPDKEMSLYDFQKMLKKDNRWQYTNQAKEEVSNTALKVLRDFGFQG
jgi:hypothetical protein